MKAKYKPIVLPRKKHRDSLNQSWFQMLDAANLYSLNHREQWQEKGLRVVSGWAIMNPKGYILPSTFAMRPSTAKARCMEPALQKFKGIISSLFSQWEARGFKCVRIKWVEG